MHLKFNLLLVFTLLGAAVSAQSFFPGSLTFTNGTIRKCLISPPADYAKKEIICKQKVNSPKEEIPNDSLSLLSITLANGEIIDFECIPIAFNENKKPSKKNWLLVLETGYATLYMRSVYEISDKHGASVVSKYTIERSAPSFAYYIKKKDKKVAVYFAETSSTVTYVGLNSVLKKSAETYLNEDPELVTQIHDKKYTHRDVFQIIRIYNEFMLKKLENPGH